MSDRRAHLQPTSRPRPAGSDDLVLGFMRLLWAVDHALNTRSKRMTRTVGVTGPQRLVIRMLGAHPGSAPGEIAAMLHTDPSTLTGVLKRLESRRLIERRTDPADLRRAILRLTAAGQRIDAKTGGTVEEAVARTIRASPRTRLVAASALLRTLVDELADADDVRKDRPTRRRRGPGR